MRVVLAETFHRSSAPFPPKFKEEWSGRNEKHDALRDRRRQGPGWPQTARRRPEWKGTRRQVGYDEEDAEWGTRPASLAEPPGPQERAQRHMVEHIVDFASHVGRSARPNLGIVEQSFAGDTQRELQPSPTSTSCCSLCHAEGGTVGGRTGALLSFMRNET